MRRVKIGMGNAELTAEKGTIYEKFTQKMTILHKERRTERWNNGMMGLGKNHRIWVGIITEQIKGG